MASTLKTSKNGFHFEHFKGIQTTDGFIVAPLKPSAGSSPAAAALSNCAAPSWLWRTAASRGLSYQAAIALLEPFRLQNMQRTTKLPRENQTARIQYQSPSRVWPSPQAFSLSAFASGGRATLHVGRNTSIRIPQKHTTEKDSCGICWRKPRLNPQTEQKHAQNTGGSPLQQTNTCTICLRSDPLAHSALSHKLGGSVDGHSN